MHTHREIPTYLLTSIHKPCDGLHKEDHGRERIKLTQLPRRFCFLCVCVCVYECVDRDVGEWVSEWVQVCIYSPFSLSLPSSIHLPTHTHTLDKNQLPPPRSSHTSTHTHIYTYKHTHIPSNAAQGPKTRSRPTKSPPGGKWSHTPHPLPCLGVCVCVCLCLCVYISFFRLSCFDGWVGGCMGMVRINVCVCVDVELVFFDLFIINAMQCIFFLGWVLNWREHGPEARKKWVFAVCWYNRSTYICVCGYACACMY
jgi:hypothetical protein